MRLIDDERAFMLALVLGLVVVGLVYPNPFLASWVGFAIAGYSVVANDSIQTVGTFIASNKDKPWWMLWLFIGGIFALTIGYSFYTYGGDVTYERLAAKGFETAPTQFSYLQVAAPLVLVALTRARVPVSTTFLILSCFATTPSSIGKVLTKSVVGYGIAFGVSIVAFFAVSKAITKWAAEGKAGPGWRVAQWCTTGLLWSVWIMQDAANVAVYLPRSLSLLELGAFVGVIFFGLGLLFRFGGARVQKVVDEKSFVTDVRAATILDLVYAVILYVFKMESKMPMSTTWVFIGLLAGRELAMSLRGASGRGVKESLKMAAKDLGLVTLGLLISLALALAVNDAFRQSLLGF